MKGKYDLILVSEPYGQNENPSKITGYTIIGSGRACIYLKRGIEAKTMYCQGESVAIKIGATNIVSAYWSPNIEIERGLWELTEIIQNKEDEQWIITGDLNIGLSPVVDQSTLPYRKRERSEKAQIYIEAFDLRIENNTSPTCRHMDTESINDYTLTKQVEIKKWQVQSEISYSNHEYITFTAKLNNTIQKEVFLKKTTDLEKFAEGITTVPSLLPYNSKEDTLKNADTITEWLSATIHNSTITQETGTKPWWNETLTELKRKTGILNVKIRKENNIFQKDFLKSQFRDLKKEYKKEIENAKERNWRAFITNSKAWGRPYKIIVKGSQKEALTAGIIREDGTPTKNKGETDEYLLKVKFPESNNPPAANLINRIEEEIDFTDAYEIRNLLRKRNNKSAPGPDQIRWKHMKTLNIAHPISTHQ